MPSYVSITSLSGKYALNVLIRLRIFPRLLCQIKTHTNMCFHAEHFWSTNFYFLDVWSCREIKSGAKQNCWICVAVGVRGGAHHTIPCVRCVCVCVCVCVRGGAHHTIPCVRPPPKILGERQGGFQRGAARGLFWWRGSINIALLPPRLLVCLPAHRSTVQRS